jgi:hypothetical protein
MVRSYASQDGHLLFQCIVDLHAQHSPGGFCLVDNLMLLHIGNRYVRPVNISRFRVAKTSFAWLSNSMTRLSVSSLASSCSSLLMVSRLSSHIAAAAKRGEGKEIEWQGLLKRFGQGEKREAGQGVESAATADFLCSWLCTRPASSS